jgi:enoyl-CoA hydratase/carnithine racemase
MSLTLSQVIEEAGKQDIGYVFDAPFHYILLTRNDNTWDVDYINQYLAVLD